MLRRALHRMRLPLLALLLAAPAVVWVGAHLLLGPIPWSRLEPPMAQAVLDRNGEPLRLFIAEDEMWRLPVRLEALDPKLIDAMIAYEDRWFEYHPGVNPLALVRASGQAVVNGRVVSGGSTLTMQVARMAEPKPRTVGAKLFEIGRALQLEARLSKQEVLAAYFRLAPYGGNLVGVEGAAQFYFGHTAQALSWAETALLVALPQSPEARRPDRFPDAARAARNRVLRRLHGAGLLDRAELALALTRPVPHSRQPVPMDAPHLARKLNRSYPRLPEIVTTIDGPLQRKLQEQVARHVAMLRPRGITNAAVVVIENDERALRAAVGSTDFFDAAHAGQVDGTDSPRSPGSTLKPLVYARALDEGLIVPASPLPDVPVDYSGYRPENYDGKYRGLVSAREALRRSLNVPAVRLDALLGRHGLWSILDEAGIGSLTGSRLDYGLTLVLGGGEITLLELTNLYATLAQGGLHRPLRIRKSQPLSHGRPLFGAGAAFLVSEMLREVVRPELDEIWEATVDRPRIAWKTGTSYGRKDAWSVGYTPRWTVGVWVGNMDGEGNPALVGSQAAAPLLLAIMDHLEAPAPSGWFEAPPEVRMREVCALSGQIPGPYCPHTQPESFIYGVSSVAQCEMHWRFQVDAASGEEVCAWCAEGREIEQREVTIYPREVAAWMRTNGFGIQSAPRHNRECRHVHRERPPLIRSPRPHGEYRLRSHLDARAQRIPLIATVSNEVEEVFWFVDQTLHWQGAPGETVFWTPEAGTHTLTCMDQRGMRASVTIDIQ